MNPSRIFIERPIMTTLVMIAILFFGIVAYKKLPVSDLPNVDYPAIAVTVNYPGASPETMANNVVSPLERQFLTIGGLQSIASTSSTGGATIVLQFSLDKPLDSAALDVETAINEATPQLPQDLPYAPVFKKVNPSQTPIIYFALTSATMPLYDLYDYAYTLIGERLSTISGVAQVVVYGNPFAVRVQVNPQKLAAKGIGMDEVASAIKSQNVQAPTGTLYGNHTEYTIDVDGQIAKAELYDSIIIKNQGGSIVRVRDIGKAYDSLRNDKQYMRYISQTEDVATVVFGIQTQSGANSLEVIAHVDKILPKLEEILPKSITLNRLFDKSEFIKEAVFDVEITLILAFLLVVLVIFFYLGKITETLIPALALPLSIFGTFAIMSIVGYSVDILSLLAMTLSIGFLVDDAVVVLENIVRHVENGDTPLQAALKGSQEIGFTILSMTLSLTSVFIPFLFMGGVVGKLFHEFAVVIVVAILISGFLSLSLTPMLCSLLIPQHQNKEKGKLEKFSLWINDKTLALYEKTLRKVFNYPKITLSLGVFSIGLSLFLFKLIPGDFLPPDDIGFVVIHAQSSDGTSPFQMIEYQKKIASILKKSPYLASAVSLGAFPDDNKGIVFMRLTPFAERPSIFPIMKELREELMPIPGIQVNVKPLPLISLQVATSDTKAPYQYTLQGLDIQALYDSAPKMIEKIKQVAGFTQVSTDLEVLQPQLNIHILRDRASVLNVSSAAIESALSYAFAAINLSPINEPENQYYAVLEVEPKFYRDPAILSQLYVRAETGQLVPLNAVTEMKESVGPLNVNRINGLPAVNIFFDLENLPLETAIKNLTRISQETLPPSVVGQVQGAADVFQASFGDLTTLLVITIFMIYIILGILYENFLHPLTVMSTLPPAAVGGVLTLFLFGYPFSLYAFVGIILLLGIVMKNGIILVDFANASRLDGKSAEEAIYHACRTRLRPILMTTFAALMGAVPISLGMGGMTAQSRIPLGLVIVGGLIFSQLITLYLTPVTYLYLEKLKEWISSKRAGGTSQTPNEDVLR